MLSTMYMVKTNTVQVSLPQAATAAQETRPNIVSITVTDRGDVLYDRDEMANKELALKLQQQLSGEPDTVFVLRADRKTDYEYVVKVLDTLKQAGAKHVSIATEIKGEK